MEHVVVTKRMSEILPDRRKDQPRWLCLLWWGGGQVQVRYEACSRREQDDRRDREGSLTS